jgi:hypothetical protein
MKKCALIIILLLIPVQAWALTIYFVDGNSVEANDIYKTYQEGTVNAPNPFSAEYDQQVKMYSIVFDNGRVVTCSADKIDWKKTDPEIKMKRIEQRQDEQEQELRELENSRY